MGQLTALELLSYLYSNQLTGTIPVEMGKLISLQQLMLYRNQLTGTIPTTVAFLEIMDELLLQDNFLVASDTACWTVKHEKTEDLPYSCRITC